MPISSARTSLVAAGLVFALALSGILMGCSGTATVETGRTFDPSYFSEADAREVLGVAVRQECAKSTVGISPGLAGALRTVEQAPTSRLTDGWEFRSGGKTALVNPSGVVSGELLEALISQC